MKSEYTLGIQVACAFQILRPTNRKKEICAGETSDCPSAPSIEHSADDLYLETLAIKNKHFIL